MGRTHFFPAPWYPVKGYSGLSHESRGVSGRLVATVACPYSRFFGQMTQVTETQYLFHKLPGICMLSPYMPHCQCARWCDHLQHGRNAHPQ
jgi:hypothetical protein